MPAQSSIEIEIREDHEQKETRFIVRGLPGPEDMVVEVPGILTNDQKSACAMSIVDAINRQRRVVHIDVSAGCVA